MQLESTISEQNIKKEKKKPTMKNLSRFMQRNEWDTADVTGLVLPWILTSAKAAN